METLGAFWNEHFTPPLSWAGAGATAIVVVALLEVLYRIVFRWLRRVVARTQSHLDDVLLRRMRLPAQVLVVLVGGNVLFRLRGVEHAALSQVVTVVELLLIAYLVIEACETALVDFWLGERKQVRVPPVVRGLGLIVLYTVAVLSVIGTVTGINLAPILATSTVLTVVLGLALQDTLGNLFSGLALSLERPCAVGDWILVDGIEGKIVDLGWRGVQIETFSFDIVTIPNVVLAKSRVQNYSRPTAVTARNCDVLAAADAAPYVVETAARAACGRLEGVLKDPAPRVWLVQMTPYGQHWTIKVWLDDFAQHDEAESRVRRAFLEEARTLGIAAGGAPTAVAVPEAPA